MWQFGILLYEMLIGQTPFDADNEVDVYRNILGGSISFPWFFDGQARDLINQLLAPMANERPKPKELCAHPFFLDIDWYRVESKTLPVDMIPMVPKLSDPFDTSNLQEIEEDSDSDDEDEDGDTRGRRPSVTNYLQTTGKFAGFRYVPGWQNTQPLSYV